MSSKKIIVLAYMLSPNRGSEYSVAWNHLVHMSKFYEISVIYGCAGEHMGDFEEVDDATKKNYPSIDFVAIHPDRFCNYLNFLNRTGIFKPMFYLAYRRWHILAAKKILKMLEAEKFTAVHYLGPIGYREPGFIFDVNVPYIWGPIGGLPDFPVHLLAPNKLKHRAVYTIKNILNRFQKRRALRVRKAMRECDILLAATQENKLEILNCFQRDATYLPENGMRTISPLRANLRGQRKGLRLLWIGDGSARKGLDIFLESLDERLFDFNVRIDIIGVDRGGDFASCIKSEKLLDIVTFHGRLARTQVYDFLCEADALVITSLSEGNPTIMWEALESEVPMIYFNHCGMKDVLGTSLGIPIDVYSRSFAIIQLKKTLVDVAQAPHKLDSLKLNIISERQKFSWNEREDFWKSVYDSVS